RRVRIVHDEIVGQKIMIASDLKIVGWLIPHRFNPYDPVPIHIRIRQAPQLGGVQYLCQMFDHKPTKSDLGVAAASLDLSHPEAGLSANFCPTELRDVAFPANDLPNVGGDDVAGHTPVSASSEFGGAP